VGGNARREDENICAAAFVGDGDAALMSAHGTIIGRPIALPRAISQARLRTRSAAELAETALMFAGLSSLILMH
jgi:hypothetical protein